MVNCNIDKIMLMAIHISDYFEMAAKRGHGSCNSIGDARGSLSSGYSDGGSLSSSSDDEDRYIPQNCKGKTGQFFTRYQAILFPIIYYIYNLICVICVHCNT